MDDIRNYVQVGIDFVKGIDYRQLTRTAQFWLFVGVFVGLGMTFWRLIQQTGYKWMRDDYYSHGWIVPILIAWQIKLRRDDWNNAPTTDGRWAILAFVPILFIQYISFIGDFWATQCLMFIAAILTSLWLLFGFKKALTVALPVSFIIFALPVFGSMIDQYTNKLQIVSTDVAELILRLFGFNPYRYEGTNLQLNHYALTVAVPCSGLKLLIAVTCFTTHFVLIARKDFVFNILMFVLVVPLCLLINGLRIALIGAVGEWFGADAAHSFHDWSGYITLVLCFIVLFKFARMFGWKD